jgi:N-acetylneuraminic acid mutarotase
MPSTIQRLFALVAAALLLLVLSVNAQEPQPAEGAPRAGAWIKLAPFPEPAQEIGGTVMNGKLYIFGGLPAGQNSTPKGIVWEYDTATNQWTQKKRMPYPAHHVAVTSYRGKIYIFGGGTQPEPGGPNWVPTNKAWEYDPVADSWKELAPMPTARGAAVAAEAGGKLYVIGGASVHPGNKLVGLTATVPHRALNTNEAYDPATNTWQTRNPMPTPRNHAAIGVVNGKIYVLGGRMGAVFVVASNSDVVEEYDPATDQWGLAKAKMPRPRSGVGFGTYKGKIYVAGGEWLDNEIVGAFRDVDVFDPVANKWTSLPPLSVTRHGLVAGVIGNRFYAVSGHLQSGAVFGDAMDSDVNEALPLE